MVGYYQSEADLPWAGKCICNYVFVVSSLSYSSSPCFFSFLLLFRTAYHSVGPLLGEKHRMGVKSVLCVCVRVMQRLGAAGADGVDVLHLLKNITTCRG